MFLAELERIGGRKAADDAYFNESYETCKIFQRKGIVVVDDEELCHEVIKEFPCHASQCSAIFRTLLDFEMHYNSCHQYACTICKKSIQNPRLLDIHIQEMHDNFFSALSKKQPMYRCYVLGCELKFWNSTERNSHCITAHKFPKSYRFGVPLTQTSENEKCQKQEPRSDKMDIDEGSDKQNKSKSKSKPKKIYFCNQKTKMFTAASSSVDSIAPVENKTQSNPVNINKTSALMFVPRQVQKSYSKALTKNQNAERNVLESETMMDLAESLPQ